MDRWRALLANRGAHLAIISLAAAGLYLNTLHHGFDFDTPGLLLYNTAVHGLSLEHLRLVFTSLPNSVEYLPVRDLTYMLDYDLWGLRPLGYHLSNVFYYAACCAALYLLLEQLLRRWLSAPRPTACAATLIFLAHPVHVESVAGIAQRKDLVSGLFLMLGLLLFCFYQQRRRLGFYFASLLAFVLALLAKATAVMMPLLISLLLLPEIARGPRRRRCLLEWSGFVAVGVPLALLMIRMAKGTGILFAEGSPLLLRLLTAAKVTWWYLRLLAIPYPLTIMHELEPASRALDPLALVALAGVVLAAAGGVVAARRRPALAFSGTWFLITILPVCGLLPAPNLVAERYLFLPAAGFALAIGWFATQAVGRRSAFAAVTTVVLITAVFSGLVLSRNREWRTNESLLLSDHRKSPSSRRLTTALGRYYFVNRKYQLAFEYFEQAKRIEPRDIERELFAAWFKLQHGDPAGALALLDSVDTRRLVDAQCLYGMIYERMGLVAQAREHYHRAIDSDHIIGVLFKSEAQKGLARLAARSPR